MSHTINLTGTSPTIPDPEGWDDMTPEEQKRWIQEHHPEEAARRKVQQEAVEASRKRIAALEANLSSEAKAQWDEMCGRGKTDPLATQEHATEEAARREVESLIHEQNTINFFLRLLFKFDTNEQIRGDITEKTAALRKEYESWAESEWADRDDGIVSINEDGTYVRGKTKCPKSFQQLAAKLRQNLAAYEKMLNLYRDIPCAPSIQAQLAELKELQCAMDSRLVSMESKQNETQSGVYIVVKNSRDAVKNSRDSKTAAESALETADSALKVAKLARDDIGDVGKKVDRVGEVAVDARNIAAQTAANLPTLSQAIDERNHPNRKDKNTTIGMDLAVEIMEKICRNEAVTERRLRQWVKNGSASKCDLPITWAAFSSVESWSAWCKTYAEKMYRHFDPRKKWSYIENKDGGNPPAHPDL